MPIMKIAILAVSMFATQVLSFAGESRDLSKKILDSIGFIDANLDMPWQHWQSFTEEQKAEFESKCQYNRVLLEADLIDYLSTTLTLDELRSIDAFYASSAGKKWSEATSLRGGFQTLPLNNATAEWRENRYSEARSYAGAVLQNKEWTTPAYRGVVGETVAPRGSAYDGSPQDSRSWGG